MNQQKNRNSLFLSLGSNIEPKKDFICNAIRELNKYFIFDKKSSLYLSSALDYLDQDDFYNICVKYYSKLADPFEILIIIKNIENKIGRSEKIIDKGPREIDIDILFFNNIKLENEILIIPHERMFKRKFVMLPLLEIIDNDCKITDKYAIINFIKQIEDQKVEKIGEINIE